jgi:hypothetical protein
LTHQASGASLDAVSVDNNEERSEEAHNNNKIHHNTKKHNSPNGGVGETNMEMSK